MRDISLSNIATVREYIAPRYISWPISNLIYYSIVLWKFKDVTVEPGQGGTGAVYIWPTYWTAYGIQDVMFSSPEYTWSSLILNYLVGIAPLYVATNVSLNLVLPSKYRAWVPSLSAYSWVGVVVVLGVTYITAHLFWYAGVVFWLVVAATSLGTAVWVTATGTVHRNSPLTGSEN